MRAKQIDHIPQSVIASTSHHYFNPSRAERPFNQTQNGDLYPMKATVKTYLAELKSRHQITEEQREQYAQKAEDVYRHNGYIAQYPGLTAHDICQKLVDLLPQGYTYHSVLNQGLYNVLSMTKPQDVQEAEIAEFRAMAVAKVEEQAAAKIQAELDDFVAEEEARAVEAAQQKERDRIAQLKADLLAEMSKP